jgi:predicted protein tyrosine phosphatase
VNAQATPLLKITSQAEFQRNDLSPFGFAVSIQNRSAYPVVLRPDFQGRRLDLYFDDVVEGPGMAQQADIDALAAFGWQWTQAVRREPGARIIIHCGAGVSRSAAAALLLLSLYCGAYHPAVIQLLRVHPHAAPNALLLRLIYQKLGPAYGSDILESLAQARLDVT